jgi:hypothetical protein
VTIKPKNAFAAKQQRRPPPLVGRGLHPPLNSAQGGHVEEKRPMPIFNGSSGLAPGLTGLSTRELLDASDSLG